MNRLRTSITILAQSPAFRKQVVGAAKVLSGTTPPPGQPDPSALSVIDGMFRAQNIHLSVYDLAEVNRWMVLDTISGGKASSLLDQYWAAVGSVATGVSAGNTASMLEAISVLLIDPDFRGRFIARTDDLSKRGFSFDTGKEEALRAAVTPAAVGNIADAWLALSWPGGECLSRLDFYPKYNHPNM